MTKSQLVSKLMESIPYYTAGRENLDFSVHQMQEPKLENLHVLKNAYSENTHHYHMVVLFYDGSHIQSFSWQYMPVSQLKNAIKNVIYLNVEHGGFAVILMKDYKATPDISIAVW